MATEKQIKANRLNAQKSTGPKTMAGKAISSRNALKTGEFAKTEAARAIAEYGTLIADFTDEFDPKTPAARFYVRMLVQAVWQTRQLRRIESSIWRDHMAECRSEEENSSAVIFPKAYKELDRVGRAIESADNSFHSALKQLLAIRARERKAAAKHVVSAKLHQVNSGLALVS